jgi:tRNA dimethylallyltransferase
MGPTAVGKTVVAECLAERIGARIINADAFQMYKYLDIGTAKPTNRHLYELLDILEPQESCTVGRFVRLAREILARELQEGRPGIVCGGTGLYIRALFEEYSEMKPPPEPGVRKSLEESLRRMGPEELLRREGVDPSEAPPDALKNPVRLIRFLEKRRLPAPGEAWGPPWHSRRFKVGLYRPPEDLRRRIVERFDEMMYKGWLEEVRALLARGITEETPAFRAIGYRELARVVRGELDLFEAKEMILKQMWQYARRQMTWLRKEPNLRWVDAQASPEETAREISRLIFGEEDGDG